MLTGLQAVLGALAEPLVDPGSRTWWGSLVLAAVVAGLWAWRHRPGWTWAGAWAALRHPSSVLDLQLALGRQLLGLLTAGAGLGAVWTLATWLVRGLDGWLGVPVTPDWSPWAVTALYSAVLFVAWDASRFALHWLLHRVPALWAFHQVHHSAEVLTPLTFHRIHPLESWLYTLRGIAVTAPITAAFFWVFRAGATSWELLGVPAAGLVLNAVFGNLRHSHVWLRFPAAVERWLISPAQHQLHHSRSPDEQASNLGTWLAVWDRWAGSLKLAGAPPVAFGLEEAERNHGDDLISAWFGPLRGLVPQRWVLAGLLVAPVGVAHGSEGEEALEEEEEEVQEAVEDEDEGGEPQEEEVEPGLYGLTILVVEDGTVRAAGSAHALDEEDLSRFEYDNIEQIVAEVPGVTSRSEDGFGLRPNLGIRGANSDRSAKVTLMEDGVLLAPAPYAAPAAYYFPMSTRLIGVEVFKGPAATRHGPNTVGGAVNLRTREVPDGLAYGLDLAGGLRLTGKVHGWAGTSGDRAGVLIEGVHLHANGFKELDGGGPTGFDRSEVMAKGWWSPLPAHRFALKLGYAHETSHETYLGLTASDLEATPYRRYAASGLGRMDWHRTQAELAWQLDPSEQLQVRTVAYHHFLDRAWTKLNGFADGPDLHDLLQADPTGGQSEVYLAILRGEEDSVSADQALLIGTNDRRYHSGGVQTRATWSVAGERLDSSLELGARLHHDAVWRLHTERAYGMQQGELVDLGGPLETTTDSLATATALALHAHEDLSLGELHLLPGARVEIVRTQLTPKGADPEDPVTRAALLPGGAVLYGLTDDLDLFGGGHRGFSPVAPGQPIEVEPEISWNYELGGRWANGERHLEVVGFFNDYKNLTGTCTLSGGCDGDSAGQQFNGGAVWVYGVEAVLGWTLLPPLPVAIPISATYAWTGSTFRTGFVSGFPQFGTVEVGDSLPYVPRHQGQLRASVVHDRWSLSVGATGRSGLLDEAGTFPIDEGDVPALVLVDAAANLALGERFQLYATGTNLTNRKAVTSWRPFGARPTAPLLVMVGLKLAPPTPEDAP